MRMEYLIKLEELNAAILFNHHESEPREMMERIEAFKARTSGTRPKRSVPRSRQIMFQRDELSKPYTEALQGLLSEAQFASLPQAQRFLERQLRLERLRTLETMGNKQVGELPQVDLTNPSRRPRIRPNDTNEDPPRR